LAANSQSHAKAAFVRDNSSEMSPMSDAQAARLKLLAEDAFELEAFHPRLSQAEAERRIAALTAKLRRQDGPPHTL
jgi:hypothetical protein